MPDSYLASVRSQFAFYRMLGTKTIEQMTDEQLFWQYHDESNSIAMLVQHISGNLLSRFTDFLTTDGEMESRDRDSEFEVVLDSREGLLQCWDAPWDTLFAAVDSLSVGDLEKIVYIRNEAHTVTEALNRALTHTSYHVGQIVHTGVMLRGEDWKTLSVPRGESSKRNEAMFSKPKRSIGG